MESIFDHVFRTTSNLFRNFTPFCTNFLVKVDYQLVFLSSPRAMINTGVKIVDISLSNLLSSSSWHFFGNFLPIQLISCFLLFGNQRNKVFVFRFSPHLSSFLGINSSPSLWALNGVSVWDVFGNFIPIVREIVIVLMKKIVFFFSPHLDFSLFVWSVILFFISNVLMVSH